MNRFTIYCTEEQTRKALELGAPINVSIMVDILRDNIGIYCFLQGGDAYWFPTAEQIVGWLESQGIHIELEYDLTFDKYDFCILDEDESVAKRTMYCDYFGFNSFSNLKDATLAAIDTALEYLEQNKTGE